jgi:hypothetical protein
MSPEEIERAKQEWLEADRIWSDYVVAAAKFALRPASTEPSLRKYELENIARMDEEADRLNDLAEAAQDRFREVAGLPALTFEDRLQASMEFGPKEADSGGILVTADSAFEFPLRRRNVATRVATRVLNHVKGWKK